MYPYDDRDLKTYYVPPPPPPASSGIVEAVIIPILQALITAFLAGILAGSLSAIVHVKASPWLIGFVVGNIAALTSWLSYRGHWSWRLEKLLGIDLNHDSHVGPPPPAEPQSIRVELLQEQGRQGDFIDLPYPEKLPQLAVGLLAGRTFAQESFNHVLKRDKFNEVRDVMLTRGLARWKVEGAPTQGVELTPAGRAIMKRLAGTRPPLPPGE